MITELTAYNHAHGDCNVPAEWKGNPKLGRWCSTLRRIYKGSKLSAERIRQLEQLGFEWGPLAAQWEETVSALLAYQQSYGDCNVPQGWKDNPALGSWCNTQRQLHKKNKLSIERIKRLEGIGFQFNVGKSKRK